jgi:hypothetical protein
VQAMTFLVGGVDRDGGAAGVESWREPKSQPGFIDYSEGRRWVLVIRARNAPLSAKPHSP